MLATSAERETRTERTRTTFYFRRRRLMSAFDAQFVRMLS